MNLAPNTAVLWRGPGVAQVGGDRTHHVLMENLHASDQIWLSNQARSPRSPEPAQASPELIARLSSAHLIDDEDRRVLLRVGVLGATPGTVLALRSLVDTLRLSLAVDAEQQVDEDWDRVFGGAFTGTPRPAPARCDAI